MAIKDGLVTYYSFQNNANDSTVNGINGTVINGPLNFQSGVKGNGIVGNSTSYIEIDNPNLNLYDAFSTSFWIYVDNTITPDYYFILSRTSNNGYYSSAYEIRLNPDGIVIMTSGLSAPPSVPLTKGQFNHVVITREPANGSNRQHVYIYVNGVLCTSVNDTILTGNSLPSNKTYIGTREDGYSFLPNKIKLDEMAIWNRALTQVEVTQLYNSGAGMSFVDINPAPPAPVARPLKWLTQVTASELAVFEEGLDANSQKITNVGYGSGVVTSPVGSFNGSNSYLRYTDNSAFDLENTDFTIEGWFNTNSDSPQCIIYKGTLTSNVSFGVYLDSSKGGIVIETNNSNSDANSYVFTAPTVIAKYTWHHLAVTYSTNTSMVSVWFNGQLIGQSYGAVKNKTADVTIGVAAWNSPVLYFSGYMDDFRITKGVQRYTSAFTPPQAELSLVGDAYAANVSLLLNMNGTNNSTNFIDSSNNNLSSTIFGNAVISTTNARTVSNGGSSLPTDALAYGQLTGLSSSIKTYVDAADATIQGNLNGASGSLKSYIDAADTALQNNINTVSSSLVSYVNAADTTLQNNIDSVSSSVVAYVDAADQALQSNIDSVSGSLKTYVDAADQAFQASLDSVSGSMKSYVDARETALQGNINDLSASASSSLAAETAARSAEDATLLKLDGSRAMTGDLNMGDKDIVSAGSGTFAGDLIVQGVLQTNGTVTSLNTTNLDVTDKLVTIGKGSANAAAANGAGIEVDGAGVSLTYDSVSSKWVSDIGLSVASEASYDGAMKLSGSAFVNISTGITSGKFDVSDALHQIDLGIGNNSTNISDAYNAARYMETGSLSSGEATINLTTNGGAMFATSEIDNISLEAMVDQGSGWTNYLVSAKVFVDSGVLKVIISAPAAESGDKYRLIVVNHKAGVLQ